MLVSHWGSSGIPFSGYEDLYDIILSCFSDFAQGSLNCSTSAPLIQQVDMSLGLSANDPNHSLLPSVLPNASSPFWLQLKCHNQQESHPSTLLIAHLLFDSPCQSLVCSLWYMTVYQHVSYLFVYRLWCSSALENKFCGSMNRDLSTASVSVLKESDWHGDRCPILQLAVKWIKTEDKIGHQKRDGEIQTEIEMRQRAGTLISYSRDKEGNIKLSRKRSF